jgi:hypothetical protein
MLIMAILELYSSNPQFSYIIGKNPASGMLIKGVRKGKAYGWYPDETRYAVYFKDGENEISYPKEKDEQFEYLNVSRYNSPLFPLSAITDFFSSVSKKEHPSDIEGYSQKVTVLMVSADTERYLEFFKTHFPEYELSWEVVAHKNVRIEIKTDKSIHHLLNYVNVLFLFLSLMAKEYIDLSDEAVGKFIRAINTIDAPYFIRYLFARNALLSKDKFFKNKPLLEQTNRYTINLAYGNTAVQRQNWITSQLQFDRTIIDVGCGEGAYAIPYSKKIAPLFVHAIDIDETVREKLSLKIKKREIDNILLYSSLEEFLATYENEECDVILTEVIEHMSKTQAAELIQQVLKLNWKTFMITTPNVEFNDYYSIDSRHDDHKWEMSTDEFNLWLAALLPETVEASFHGIGDSINGVHTTQGAILTRKEENHVLKNEAPYDLLANRAD